jgi:hypothetical protein
MQSIGKWPEKAMHMARKGYAGHSQKARKVMQSIGKWPKSYAEHSHMARKVYAHGQKRVCRA